MRTEQKFAQIVTIADVAPMTDAMQYLASLVCRDDADVKNHPRAAFETVRIIWEKSRRPARP